MKNTSKALAIALLALLGACSPGNRNDDTNRMNDSISLRDSIDRERDKMRVEMDDYRNRIRARIDEMQRDIEATRERWKAERNAKKQREFEVELKQKESRRETLQQKLDRMGDDMEEGWQEFKRDVDDFFSNDHRSDEPNNTNDRNTK